MPPARAASAAGDPPLDDDAASEISGISEPLGLLWVVVVLIIAMETNHH